ncbi:MAG: hypothetical protein ACSHX0_02445 [Akkermansiaceae bacterium]
MKTSIILAGIFATFLSSCSTKLTEEQKAILSTVSIEKTSIETTAYQDPHGAAVGTAANVAMATGGGLIGALIGETVSASQNKMFKNAESSNIERIKSLTPHSLAPVVNNEIQAAIKENTFFSSRIQKQSPNRFTSKIIRYTLNRTGKSDSGLLMSPSITAEVKLVGSDGETIGRGWLPVTGVSPMSYTLSQYIATPALLKKGYAEAAASLAMSLEDSLAMKTAK